VELSFLDAFAWGFFFTIVFGVMPTGLLRRRDVGELTPEDAGDVDDELAGLIGTGCVVVYIGAW
jgi:hypothetical protein